MNYSIKIQIHEIGNGKCKIENTHIYYYKSERKNEGETDIGST